MSRKNRCDRSRRSMNEQDEFYTGTVQQQLAEMRAVITEQRAEIDTLRVEVTRAAALVDADTSMASLTVAHREKQIRRVQGVAGFT